MNVNLNLLAKKESRGVKMKATKIVKMPIKDSPELKD